MYGASALSHSSIKRWVVHFKNGSSDITDKECSGRPLSAVTEENKRSVDELIRSDRRITVRASSTLLELVMVVFRILFGNWAIQKFVRDGFHTS